MLAKKAAAMSTDSCAHHRKKGTAAVELGVAIPFLLVLLVGTVEIGTAMYQAMQVYNAAESGMLYAAKHGWSSAGITAAVNASGPTGTTASPAPTQFCGCPGGSGIAVISCSSTCTGGNSPGQYAQINAALAHETILPYLGLPLPATLTAQSLVRLN
jgi:hypothetical protein